MEPPGELVSAKPAQWVLVFCRNRPSRLISFLAWGKYKHVRAYTFVPFMRAWLFYDVTLSTTLVMTMPDGQTAEAYLAKFTENADLVGFKTKDWQGWRCSPFSCVTAIKQLIGLRSGALRPDRLYRDCLAAGGNLLEPS